MTDLSKHTLAELETFRSVNALANEAIDAEIERRKSEPDYAAWQPKWQAFCESFGLTQPWPDFRQRYIRALIAAHNTPLAGEVADDGVSDRMARIIGAQFQANNLRRPDNSYIPGLTAEQITPLAGEDDDWIPWTGGECPVPGDTRVCVRIGTGEVLGAYKASGWDWDVPRPGPSIIAYRVVKEP